MTNGRAWLGVGAAVVVAITLGAGATRAASVGVSAARPGELTPLLVSAACLCLAGLLRDRPSLARVFLSIAAGVATADAITIAHLVRDRDPSPEAWLAPALLVAIGATTTIGLAAVAVGRGRGGIGRTALVVLVAWFGASSALVIAATEVHVEPDPAFTWLDVATLPQAFWIPAVAVLLLAAAWVDLERPVRRAWAVSSTEAGRASRTGHGSWPAFAVALADELLPDAINRRSAAERERARLASELHATVLPALRGAVADAERDGSAERLSGRLHEVQAALEDVVLHRRFVVLEELGLVEALEWLAERTEERGGATVELTVTTDTSDARPDIRAERAAFRVARLAVDNAVEHSGASTISIVVLSRPTELDLTIADDGAGLPPRSHALGPARRAAHGRGSGIAEMRDAATAVGAALAIESAAGSGVVVSFRWRPDATGQG